MRCVADRCNFLHVILRIKGEKQKPEKLLSCSQHQKPCVQAIALCFVLCLSSSENSGSCLRCTLPWPELTIGIRARLRETSSSPWCLRQDPVAVQPGRRSPAPATPARRRRHARLLRPTPLFIVQARAKHVVRAPATHTVRGRSSSSESYGRVAVPATGRS